MRILTVNSIQSTATNYHFVRYSVVENSFVFTNALEVKRNTVHIDCAPSMESILINLGYICQQ